MIRAVAALFLSILVPLAFLGTSSLSGQQVNGQGKGLRPAPRKVDKGARKEPLPAFTAEREAAALVFVEMNHPELTNVLKSLKDMRPEEYKLAIRELFDASERIADMEARDSQRAAMLRRAWSIRSRIELLVARLTREERPEFESRLRELIRQQVDHEIADLKSQKENLTTQLERITTNLERLESHKDQVVENRVRRIMRERAKPAEKSGIAAPTQSGAK